MLSSAYKYLFGPFIFPQSPHQGAAHIDHILFVLLLHIYFTTQLYQFFLVKSSIPGTSEEIQRMTNRRGNDDFSPPYFVMPKRG